MHDEGYHNWDKDTTEDFWDLVEKVDDIKRRNKAADIQMEIYNAERYRALTYRVELEGLDLILADENDREFEPPNLSKLRKKILLQQIAGMVKSGLSIREISEEVDVPCTTIHRWIQQDRRNKYACCRNDENKFQRRNMVEEAGC